MSLRIGITCYPTFGGSGIVATEIGLGLARRGHRVHFICYDVPVRLSWHENVFFHEVSAAEYPLMHQGQYALALASKLVDVCTHEGLDLMHVHYAVPHAASAYLARQVMGPKAPPLVTTLHGTDITLVGADPSYLPITRHAIEQSQGVTTPSDYLREATWERLGLSRDTAIEVIPNFVDTATYRPPERRDRSRFAGLCARYTPPLELAEAPVLFHVSNFRPVKRVQDVISIFAEVARQRPVRLVLVGDGPDRSRAEQRVRQLGLCGQVCFLGKQDIFVELLQHADVFLLPSETESFGLAALEALSCGVPVVGTAVGGLPEVVSEGVTGRLLPPGDVAGMTQAVLDLLDDPEGHAAMSRAARASAVERYSMDPLVSRYVAFYQQVLDRSR